MKTDVHIDTTTLYGTINLFSHGKPQDGWAWRNAIELGAFLVEAENLTLSPVPFVRIKEANSLGQFVHLLQKHWRMKKDAPDHTKDRAISLTKSWARRNKENIQKKYKIMWEDLSFSDWIGWNADFVWREHCRRLGGIADKGFRDEVSMVLEWDKKIYDEIQRLSFRKDFLDDIIIKKSGSDFSLTVDAYVTSIIIRGAYYCYLARELSEQFFPHQIRSDLILPKISSQKYAKNILEDSPKEYLYKILTAAAFREDDLERRLITWVNLLLKTRQRYNSGIIILKERHTTDANIEVAVDAAKKIGVKLTGKWVETVIEIGPAIGTGLIISCLLEGWREIALVLTTPYLTYLANKKISKSKKIAEKLSEHKLSDLAKSNPGLIKRSVTGAISISKDS